MATIKPFWLALFRGRCGRAGDHAVNGAVRRDEGVGMRQKRHDSFRGT